MKNNRHFTMSGRHIVIFLDYEGEFEVDVIKNRRGKVKVFRGIRRAENAGRRLPDKFTWTTREL